MACRSNERLGTGLVEMPWPHHNWGRERISSSEKVEGLEA